MRKAYVVGILSIAIVALIPNILNLLGYPSRLFLSTFALFNTFPKFQPTLLPGSLKGHVAIVTGGNSGIGLETTRVLAEAGATVILTARDLKRGEEAKSKLRTETKTKLDIRVLHLDLADLASVKTFVSDFKKLSLKRLDFLVLNAGKMLPNIETTKQGYESMFGSHHIGHFLLTKLLLPTLTETAADEFEARVVVTSSGAMAVSPERPSWDKVHEQSAFVAYGISKLANALFARELHRRYGNLGIVVSYNHPGAVRTPLSALEPCNYLPGFCFEPAEGALPNLKGCLADDVAGAFILPLGHVATDEDLPVSARDPVLAQELWTWTEDRIRPYV